MSEPNPPLCDASITRLVGLRRSLVSFSLHVLRPHREQSIDSGQWLRFARKCVYGMMLLMKEKLEAKDWSPLFPRYRGQWVALADDEVTVLASAPTAKAALT